LNASIENKSPQTHFKSKLEDEIRYKGRELRNGKTCRNAEIMISEKSAEPLHKGSTWVY
jgi:hypothetical protein